MRFADAIVAKRSIYCKFDTNSNNDGGRNIERRGKQFVAVHIHLHCHLFCVPFNACAFGVLPEKRLRNYFVTT